MTAKLFNTAQVYGNPMSIGKLHWESELKDTNASGMRMWVSIIHFWQHLKLLAMSWKPHFIKRNQRWNARYPFFLAWLENRLCIRPRLYQSKAQAQVINLMLKAQEKRSCRESILVMGGGSSRYWKKCI